MTERSRAGGDRERGQGVEDARQHVNRVGATEIASRIAFAVVSATLAGLALGLIGYAIHGIYEAATSPDRPLGSELLDAVGYVVISVAVFDVAKYIFEEEVLVTTERRDMAEARRSLTKFISVISIAIFLEALVSTFEASKMEDKSQMLYPTLLLFGGVAAIVGLGIYQRLSSLSERVSNDPPQDEA